MKTGAPRPFILKHYRRRLFNLIHGLSHPGIRSTQQSMCAKFVWPGINKDVRQWARTCLECQRSKIHRHTISPLKPCAPPSSRLEKVHIDIVGSIGYADGYSYVLTMIDRFTRWTEAVPLANIDAASVAKAFILGWVSRFGCPALVTTDRGRQFESALWKELTRRLGSCGIRCTAHNPKANGMIERFHRSLKAGLKANPHQKWTDSLPLVLLGLRTSVKMDLKCSSAELLYGTTLRVPGEFFTDYTAPEDPSTYNGQLRSIMKQLRPVQPRLPKDRAAFVHPDLQTSTHVFVRHDAVRKPLQQPYDGPFKVLERHEKFFILDKAGNRDSVCIDRLKPAYLELDLETPAPEDNQIVTRSGRIVRKSVRFAPTTALGGATVAALHSPSRITMTHSSNTQLERHPHFWQQTGSTKWQLWQRCQPTSGI